MKKLGYFVLEVNKDNEVIISQEMIEKLGAKAGDRVEFSLKKVISKKEFSKTYENPLYEFITK